MSETTIYDTPERAIDDLLYCMWRFDEKPHLLFSALRRIALSYEDDADMQRVEIAFMDRAYEKIGAARDVWSEFAVPPTEEA